MNGGWDRLLTPLLRARRFDEILVEHAELITGVFHVSIGMESTAAALACLRSPADVVMLSHRNHGHLAAMGTEPEQLYREILGRDGGPQRGRAGSLHLADPARGVPYTSAMLGGGAALGTGVALGKMRRGEDGVVLCFFGDGAMGEGVMFETFNLAAAWRLPVVFVCENNGRSGSEGALSDLARAHGVASATADGRLPRETLEFLGSAVDSVRSGLGPRFLEVGSEPWPGNSTFLPQLVGRLEVADAAGAPVGAFAAADPVRAELRALLSEGVETAALLELDGAITSKTRDAFARAAAAPPAPAFAAVESVWGSA